VEDSGCENDLFGCGEDLRLALYCSLHAGGGQAATCFLEENLVYKCFSD